MVAFRGLGWLLLALAVAVIVHDLLTWLSEGRYPFATLGSLWSHVDPSSLGNTQTSMRRYLGGGLWTWILRPLLAIPAVPAFLILGLLLLWIGRRDTGRPEPGLLVGSRPPRKRRRGLS
ncbi:MAG: hypothetical protein IBJ17_06695 [Reyranella sp.]|nr:hypothetical protein [Reyranella sp.]